MAPALHQLQPADVRPFNEIAMEPIRFLHLDAAARSTMDGPSLRPVAASQRPPANPSQAPTRRLRISRSLLVGAVLSCLAVATGLAGASAHHRASLVRHVGSPSIKSTPTGNPIRWPDREIVLTLDPSLDAFGPASKDAIRASIDTWLGALPDAPPVVFDNGVETGRFIAQDGVNRVSAGPIDLPGHEGDLAITVTWSDANSGEIVEVDMVFNTAHHFSAAHAHDREHDERPSGKCDGSYDLQNVATHEFGHFFGLGEDRQEPLATMFVQSHVCETVKRDLYPTDASAIAALYAPSGTSNTDLARAGCSICGAVHAPVGTFITVLVAVGMLGARRRRRGGKGFVQDVT
jgi:hypothetical protein